MQCRSYRHILPALIVAFTLAFTAGCIANRRVSLKKTTVPAVKPTIAALSPQAIVIFKRVSPSVVVVESLNAKGYAVALGSGAVIAVGRIVTNQWSEVTKVYEKLKALDPKMAEKFYREVVRPQAGSAESSKLTSYGSRSSSRLRDELLPKIIIEKNQVRSGYHVVKSILMCYAKARLDYVEG